MHRLCHVAQGPIIETTIDDDGNKEYEFFCYCKRCKGQTQNSMIRIMISKKTRSVRVAWYNYQWHIFLQDPDLWKRVVYVIIYLNIKYFQYVF